MGQELFLIIIAPLIINIGLGVYLVYAISRYGLTNTTRALVAMIIGAFLWSFGYTMEFLSPGLAAKIFWGKFQYFGILSVPLAWFSFTMLFLGEPGWTARPLRQRIALCALPALTFVLVWTNELHGLVWRDVQLQNIGSGQILAIDHGPAFWIYLAYGYVLIGVSSIRLAWSLLVSIYISRWRTTLRLLAILIPWGGNFVYVTGLNPIPNLDWSPLSFTLSGLLFSASLYRLTQTEILPIAHKKVFTVLPEGLLVLDSQDRLIDLNEAAQKMIIQPDTAVPGTPVSELLPELVHWVSLAGIDEEFSVEVVRGDSGEQRYYHLRIVPLTGGDSRHIGRLVTCNEITHYREVQAQLEQTRTRLEQAVKDRTAELFRAVEQIQVELNQRAMAEKRFEDVLEYIPDPMVVFDQAGVLRLVNAQTERMFGYAREELLGQDFDIFIAASLRKRYREYVTQFMADPAVRHTVGQTLMAQRKDGSIFPVEISLGTLDTPEGVWTACTARDITARKRAEEEQRRLFEEIRHSREQLRALAARLAEAPGSEQRQIAVELNEWLERI